MRLLMKKGKINSSTNLPLIIKTVLLFWEKMRGDVVSFSRFFPSRED